MKESEQRNDGKKVSALSIRKEQAFMSIMPSKGSGFISAWFASLGVFVILLLHKTFGKGLLFERFGT